MDELSIEILQYMVFNHACSAKDVLSLALTSRGMYRKLLGEVGEENELDVVQHKAVAGVKFCVERLWWKPAVVALERGFYDPHIDFQEVLWFVCRGDSGVKMVEALLKHTSVDPCANNHEILLFATPPAVTVLLADGRVDPCFNSNSAFFLACMKGDGAKIDALLRDSRVLESVDLQGSVGQYCTISSTFQTLTRWISVCEMKAAILARRAKRAAVNET